MRSVFKSSYIDPVHVVDGVIEEFPGQAGMGIFSPETPLNPNLLKTGQILSYDTPLIAIPRLSLGHPFQNAIPEHPEALSLLTPKANSPILPFQRSGF